MEPFDLRGFRNTAPYIHAHRGRTFVLCLDSALLESDGGADALLQDIAQLQVLGVRLALVFGARRRLDALLPDAPFHDGVRVVRAADLPAVQAAVGALQSDLQARLSRGLANTALAGLRLRVLAGNLVAARPRGVHEGVDFEHSGEVRRVAAEEIAPLLERGAVVLLPPLGYSATGEVFLLQAVELARAAAQSLRADKLIYLHAEPPLRARGRLLRRLTAAEAAALRKRRRLRPGYARLLRAAVDASLAGVERVHLLDGRRDGALLRELYTHAGDGVMLTRGDAHAPRRAEVADLGGILELLEPLVAQGVLAARARAELELHVRDFRVIEIDGLIAACAGLCPLDAERAELAGLAVHPEHRGQGHGAALLAGIERAAAAAGARALYVRTTRAMHWFRERGFRPAAPPRRHFARGLRNARVLVKELEPADGG